MEYVSPEGLRQDGRRPPETRRVHCQIGVLQNADGSAIFEMGNTKVGSGRRRNGTGTNRARGPRKTWLENIFTIIFDGTGAGVGVWTARGDHPVTDGAGQGHHQVRVRDGRLQHRCARELRPVEVLLRASGPVCGRQERSQPGLPACGPPPACRESPQSLCPRVLRILRLLLCAHALLCHHPVTPSPSRGGGMLGTRNPVRRRQASGASAAKPTGARPSCRSSSATPWNRR